MNSEIMLKGTRFELSMEDGGLPAALRDLLKPPRRVYGIGSQETLQSEGIAIVGARRATPYGSQCAARFARMLAEKGIALVTGGARGCDTYALRGCLEAEGKAIVVLGGGCDKLYPEENASLFQRIIDAGGAIMSEHQWDTSPLPYMFRARNRLITGRSKGVLIIEAGMPSGTFATADDALAAGKEVMAIPGPITSKQSRGANRLIYQGATPIVDDETFADQLFALFGATSLI